MMKYFTKIFIHQREKRFSEYLDFDWFLCHMKSENLSFPAPKVRENLEDQKCHLKSPFPSITKTGKSKLDS